MRDLFNLAKFLPHSAVQVQYMYAMTLWLSVCVSVTRQHCVITAKRKIMQMTA